MLEWLRLPAHVLIIAGGVLPRLWMSLQGVLGVFRRCVDSRVVDEGNPAGRAGGPPELALGERPT
jgi:hypothetical protein